MELGLDREAWRQGGASGIGLDFRRVQVQFLAPDRACRAATLDDDVEEAAEDPQAVAFADLRQAGVVGQRLIQIIPQIPAQAEPVGGHCQQLTLGAQTLEEENALEFEDDDWVDAGASADGIGRADELTHERQIERAFQLAVEMPWRHQILDRDRRVYGELACLLAHHCPPPPIPRPLGGILPASYPFFNTLYVSSGYFVEFGRMASAGVHQAAERAVHTRT